MQSSKELSEGRDVKRDLHVGERWESADMCFLGLVPLAFWKFRCPKVASKISNPKPKKLKDLRRSLTFIARGCSKKDVPTAFHAVSRVIIQTVSQLLGRSVRQSFNQSVSQSTNCGLASQFVNLVCQLVLNAVQTSA